jgi:hypothetical protein
MTIRNLVTKILLPVFLLQSGLTSVAAAQDFNSDPDWKISVYLWTTSLDGTLGIGPIEASAGSIGQFDFVQPGSDTVLHLLRT